jgi:hypothetical protein
VHEPIERHIAAIAARTGPERELLARTLHGDCWPDGGADALAPAAREWLRRWAPKTVGDAGLACGCASGVCAICN